MNANWDDLRCLIEVSECRSLTEAAVKLGMSVATLGRHIDALETQLALKLLHRGPTGVESTEHGKVIVEHAKAGAEHFYRLQRTAVTLKSGRRNSPIRISSTETVLSEVLAPQLPKLLSDRQNLMVDLVVSNENVDLNKREADIAIRLGQPTAPGLVARRVGDIHLGLFASSAYLGQRAPADIDLQCERILGYDSNFGEIPEVLWMKKQALNDGMVAVSSSSYALLNAALAGAGIAMLPEFLARRHGLIKIPAAAIPKRKPWLVFHRDMKDMSDIKAVKQWIIDSCRIAFSSGD